MHVTLKSSNSLVASLLLLGMSAHQGESAIVTYQFSGSFNSSDWNADSTNAAGPGGPVSGYFSIDTETQTVSEMQISTTFLSFYNSQVVMAAN